MNVIISKEMFFFINRYSLIGFFLLIVGFFTAPILVGFILMPIGSLLLCYGIALSVWEILPGHENLEPKIKKFKDQYIESSTILSMIFGKRSRNKLS
jgi:hypothetical protein